MTRKKSSRFVVKETREYDDNHSTSARTILNASELKIIISEIFIPIIIISEIEKEVSVLYMKRWLLSNSEY